MKIIFVLDSSLLLRNAAERTSLVWVDRDDAREKASLTLVIF